MRLPDAKWLPYNSALRALHRVSVPGTVIQNGSPGAVSKNVELSTVIWSQGQHRGACPVRTHPSLSWKESHTAISGVLLGESVSSRAHSIGTSHTWQRGFPGGSAVKNLPASAEDSHWSLGQEDPLELKMAAHPSMPGKSHWQRSLKGCSPWGCKESDRTEWLSTHTNLVKGLPTPCLGLTGKGQ